jgi:hypothetical protein
MKRFTENKTDRRRFFSVAGKGTLGAIILSSFPFKLLATSKYSKLKNVTVHPQAVKRVK